MLIIIFLLVPRLSPRGYGQLCFCRLRQSLVRLQSPSGSLPRRPSVQQSRGPGRHRRPPRSSRVPRVERQQLPQPAPRGHPGRPLRLRPHGPGCGHCAHRAGGCQGRHLRCPGVLHCPRGPNSRLRPRIRLRSGHLRAPLRSWPEHLWIWPRTCLVISSHEKEKEQLQATGQEASATSQSFDDFTE
ncbi:hypothetical protein IscW_ISCW003740 [Ixodes scapularis]|uniref:Secreted protein n=1 Tax=Ixodes scapularis TaxID=6945 RepID=B7PK04_IXOSC|nr:hypothetical protein IscW_ISCW003740 [Ixodes scapularis]|eukprot:XP_002408986.1 hypothetical protein IscW_ISCW003740 [Ixodes scapularis]